ncbi:MAG: hypothetical protein RL328_341 [Acidobacteriota bacterium]
MKWITLAAMGLVLAGCGQQAASTDKAADEKAAPEPAKVVTPVKPAKVITLASGTAIKIRTDSAISTKSAQTGDPFTGVLSEALKVDGEEVAPKGAAVTGLVAEADEGGRVKGVASLSLRLTKISIDGKAVPVDTGVFVKNAPATKKKDAIKVGIGAGVGAVVGAIAGGGKGAAVGAATGGAAGTGVVLATHGDPAVVDAESLITFKLKAPVEVK